MATEDILAIERREVFLEETAWPPAPEGPSLPR